MKQHPPARPAAPHITVLHSLALPDGTSKYVDQIVAGAPDEVTIRFFTWRGALAGRYDVFHVHWPELTIRGRHRLKRFFRRRAVDLLILLSATRRKPIVRTVHNVAPHEGGTKAERRTLSRYDRHTDLFIRLNPVTTMPHDTPIVTIPHGHYRELYERHPARSRVPGRVLYFGIIRPYKGVDELIDVFRELRRPDLELRIVGSPSVGQRELVLDAISGDPRISATLRFVADDELVAEISAAELVILPYRQMHNSGAILAALSLDRPALVPSTPANVALAGEVGTGWVHLFEGRLTGERVEQALSAVREQPADARPRLDERDLRVIGRSLYHAYLQAVTSVRGRGL